MPTSHPSGWAHADGALRGPSWLREPTDANSLVPILWSSTATKDDGVLSVGGVALPDLVAGTLTGRRFMLTMILVFAALAVTLAATGVYGLMTLLSFANSDQVRLSGWRSIAAGNQGLSARWG